MSEFIYILEGMMIMNFCWLGVVLGIYHGLLILQKEISSEEIKNDK